MSVTGNFTSVTLGPDDAGTEKLNVNGVSDSPDFVKAIYVAVAHAGAKQTLLGAREAVGVPHELPSTAVAAPEGAAGWTAFLEQGDPPYETGDTVLAVGVTVDSRDDSTSFWHETLAIKSDEDA